MQKVETMRIIKTLIAILIVSLIAATVAGCTGSRTTTTTTAIRNVTVTTGTISNVVTGTANLALARTQDLAFASAGTIDSVAVSLYDTVTKGTVLARLDTSTWDTQVQTLTKSLTTAQRNQTTKAAALAKAQRAVVSAEFTKRQRELDLESSQAALTSIVDVKTAQDAVDKAQKSVDFAQFSRQEAALKGNSDEISFWNTRLALFNMDLANAKAVYKDVVSATSPTISSATALQITKAQFTVETSQNAVNDAIIAINDANAAVTNARLDLADAEASILDIQSQIDAIRNNNPLITAPFDGLITAVNVKGGDSILKGKVAFQIADPNQFKANFMVSETDIFSVKVGQTAQVSVDALSSQFFPARISAIAPLATISQGVVNYQVTADITSLVPLSSTESAASQRRAGAVTLPEGVTLPADFTPGAGGARFTNLPSNAARPTSIPSGIPANLPGSITPGSAAASGTTLASVTLKQGLTASVTITIQEKRNVLVVPNRAITKAAGNSTVQLVNGTTVTTQTVKTGLSDSTNTEITDGLKAGDIVQVKASSVSTSSNVFGPGGAGQAIRIP